MGRSCPLTTAGLLCKREYPSLYHSFLESSEKEGPMTTRQLVDPELVAMLDQFPPLELTDETLGQIRAMTAAMSSQLLPNLPQFPDIAVSERLVPGPEDAPDVRILVYLP